MIRKTSGVTFGIPLPDTGLLRLIRYGQIREHILICLHGYGATGRHPTIRTFGTSLAEKGVTVISYTIPSDHAMDIAYQVTVLRNVMAHFRRIYPDIPLSLSGGSLGALICAIVATESRDIHALITTNGYFGDFRVRGKALRLYVSLKIRSVWDRTFHSRLFGYISKHHTPEKIIPPTLVIHARKDEVVRYTQSVSFYRRLRCPKRLVILDSPTADHELTIRADIRTLTTLVHDFLVETCGTRSPGKTTRR